MVAPPSRKEMRVTALSSEVRSTDRIRTSLSTGGHA